MYLDTSVVPRKEKDHRDQRAWVWVFSKLYDALTMPTGIIFQVNKIKTVVSVRGIIHGSCYLFTF